jgi:hypothetical protein
MLAWQVVRKPARLPMLLMLVLGGLAGCTTQGDFGRRQSSGLFDTVLPAPGRLLASYRDEPVSSFMHTDDEIEWRRRAWRFLMPAHPQAKFEAVLVEIRISRVVPRDFMAPAPDIYFNTLMSESWRSSKPPYRRLMLDMQADIDLLDPLDRIARQVAVTDEIREKGMHKITDLTETERAETLGRIGENKALARWIDEALAARVKAYQFALERLFIEIPEKEAVSAERMLAVLKARAAREIPAHGALQQATGPAKPYTPWGEDTTVIQK